MEHLTTIKSFLTDNAIKINVKVLPVSQRQFFIFEKNTLVGCVVIGDCTHFITINEEYRKLVSAHKYVIDRDIDGVLLDWQVYQLLGEVTPSQWLNIIAFN